MLSGLSNKVNTFYMCPHAGPLPSNETGGNLRQSSRESQHFIIELIRLGDIDGGSARSSNQNTGPDLKRIQRIHEILEQKRDFAYFSAPLVATGR